MRTTAITALFLVACPGGVTPRVGFLAPGEAVTHAVVKVNAYQGQPEVWRLRSTVNLDGRTSTALLPDESPSHALGFPATFTVKAPDGSGSLQVLVEALDQEGLAIGRAQGAVELERNRGVILDVTLKRACDDTLACSDGVYCNGEERCLEGMCEPASQVPCPPSPFDCVSQGCVEPSRTCDIRVSHDHCEPLLNPDGTMDTTYCDPVAGCVRGQPCDDDGDCQDPYVCNGNERCMAGRCIGGIPPSVDDDNPCTVDSCAEPQGAMHAAAPDGNRCGTDMVCVGGSCVGTRCGDGVVDLAANERCDNGPANSDVEPDACRVDCQLAHCGDGVPDALESCDGTPGCREDCTRCGDGVKQDVEACDNGAGNSDMPDAVCRNNCSARRCGDGITDTGEQCDQGNANSMSPNATCRPDCRLKRCGDGVQDDGEACDFGPLNADEAGSPCLTTCVLPFCGDGIVSAGETCDFGLANAESPDAPCRTDCKARRCGDGVTDTGEQCDQGNANSTSPNAPCRPDCRLKGCGDGVQDDGEACDFGALNADAPGSPCLTSCAVPFCGDGILNAGEECDFADANSQEPDAACRLDCRARRCGDDVTDTGEACDDGNTVNGDGCASTCLRREVCGDGVRDPQELCDDGNVNPADGCDRCAVTMWVAEARLGGNIPAVSAAVSPWGVAVDRMGNLFIAESFRVRRVDANGTISTVAGTGVGGYSGDGGLATNARLNHVGGVAVDGSGNLFLADGGNHCIRRVDADGVITTVAGTGSAGFSGDGGAATSARLNGPGSVSVDGLGNLYVADAQNHRIRRVDVTGSITTVVGTGVEGSSGDGGAANSARLRSPSGVSLDGRGGFYIADSGNHRVRRVDANGTISAVAGTGVLGYSGDGGPATAAQLWGAIGVVVDGMGVVFIADGHGNRIRRVDRNGTITTVAGTGVAGYSGDGAPATMAELRLATGVALNELGDLYIADAWNHRVRKVDATGTITTVAGTGVAGGSRYGGGATGVQLNGPNGVAVDGLGRVHIADTGNYLVRRVDPTGILVTIAGTGERGDSGDGGLATSARLWDPTGVAVDELGSVYVADPANNRVRRVDGSGVISVVAGTGIEGYFGDGGDATSARLDYPFSVAVDGLGNLLIADTDNHRVRQVDAAGIITTVAGTGEWGDTGDGGPATMAQVGYPCSVAVDALANVYIATSYRVRRVDASGTISTVAGTGVQGDSGDGGPATSARFWDPCGLAVDGVGNLYIADTLKDRVRRVDPTGIITTVAGTGEWGSSGDGGPATCARLNRPSGVAVDGLGNLYIADDRNGRIRRVGADGIITTVAGNVVPESMGPVVGGSLADPRALVATPSFNLFAGGVTGTLQALRHHEAWLEVVTGRYPHTPATNNLARFRDQTFGTVSGVAYDESQGRIYLSESTANRIHVVTIVDLADENTWTIATLANVAGTADFQDGPADTARFRTPTGLFLNDYNGLLYIADTGNHVIRTLDLATATVTTVVGTPQVLGFHGDEGLATEALLYQPQAITRCGNGDLFIADTGNHRVRRVDSSGIIRTVLGDGVPASSGEGFPARTFPVHEPLGLACDPFGNLFVTSHDTVRMVAADDSGVVDGEGRVFSIYGAPPRTSFPASVTRCLTGLAVVDETHVQVTDSCTGILLELTRDVLP